MTQGRKQPLIERFWAKVDRGNNDECWNWKGSTIAGYGGISEKGRRLYSHQVAYTIAYGSIPEGMWVLHQCDNRKCCNPSHLWLGTRQDNIDDMVNKDRHSRGERKGKGAKLTDDKIVEIRKLKELGISQKELAVRFSVNQSTISRICAVKNWRHI